VVFRVHEFETLLWRKIIPDGMAITMSTSCTNSCSGSFFRDVGIRRPPFGLERCRPWRTSRWCRTLSKTCSGEYTPNFFLWKNKHPKFKYASKVSTYTRTVGFHYPESHILVNETPSGLDNQKFRPVNDNYPLLSRLTLKL